MLWRNGTTCSTTHHTSTYLCPHATLVYDAHGMCHNTPHINTRHHTPQQIMLRAR